MFCFYKFIQHSCGNIFKDQPRLDDKLNFKKYWLSKTTLYFFVNFIQLYLFVREEVQRVKISKADATRV